MLMMAECESAVDKVHVVGRPWRCATGNHILGAVLREGEVSRLHLTGGHVITGHALIYCEACGRHREWHSGADGLAELLSRRDALAGQRGF